MATKGDMQRMERRLWMVESKLNAEMSANRVISAKLADLEKFLRRNFENYDPFSETSSTLEKLETHNNHGSRTFEGSENADSQEQILGLSGNFSGNVWAMSEVDEAIQETSSPFRSYGFKSPSKAATGYLSSLAVGSLGNPKAKVASWLDNQPDVDGYRSDRVTKLEASESIRGDRGDRMSARDVKIMSARDVKIMSARGVDRMCSRNVDRISSRNVDRMSSRNVDRMSSRNVDRMSARNVDRMSARNADRMSSRDVDRSSIRGGERISYRGGDRMGDRGYDRSNIRDSGGMNARGYDRSSIRGGDRMSARGYDSSSIRDGDRMSYRGGHKMSYRVGDGMSARGNSSWSLRDDDRMGTGEDRMNTSGVDRRSARGYNRSSIRGGNRMSSGGVGRASSRVVDNMSPRESARTSTRTSARTSDREDYSSRDGSSDYSDYNTGDAAPEVPAKRRRTTKPSPGIEKKPGPCHYEYDGRICKKLARACCDICKMFLCPAHRFSSIRCPDYDVKVKDCTRDTDDNQSVSSEPKKSMGRCAFCVPGTGKNSRKVSRTKCETCRRFICATHQRRSMRCEEHRFTAVAETVSDHESYISSVDSSRREVIDGLDL